MTIYRWLQVISRTSKWWLSRSLPRTASRHIDRYFDARTAHASWPRSPRRQVVKNHEKLPTGNLIQLLKMAIEIVDLPIENCDVPSFFVLVCQRLRPKTATPRRLCSVTGHRFPSRSAWKWTMEFHVAKPGPLASWLQWLMSSKYMYTWCRLYIYNMIGIYLIIPDYISVPV